MNLYKILPMLFMGSLVSCGTPNKRIPQKVIPKLEINLDKDTKLKILVADTFSVKISDRDKIIEYNKLLKNYKKNVSNYIVIDKKSCLVNVYSPDGELLFKDEVCLGRKQGDKRSGGYVHKELRQSYTTAPGEFIIDREGSKKGSNNERLYGKRLLFLKGDHTLKESKKYETIAIHQVPHSSWGQNRIELFNNGNLIDNRVSYGCINLLEESFDKLRNSIKGIGTKVYVLPEEAGNSLYLEKQANGDYKFFQKKYRYEFQEHNE